MAYAPIEDHGVIGDMHTVALIDTEATIDWCCLPRFDSVSVFAAPAARVPLPGGEPGRTER
jgi:GH15 family glucan-1,4-alpha-glucosidase